MVACKLDMACRHVGDVPIITPGQRISGILIVALSFWMNIECITIKFKGVMKTEAFSNQHNKHDALKTIARLVRLAEIVLGQPTILLAGQHEYPFAFDVPWVSRHSMDGSDISQSPYEVPLPPSMITNQILRTRARVKYFIEVHLGCPSELEIVKFPVLLIPRSLTATQIVVSNTSRLLIVERSNRRPSLREVLTQFLTREPTLRTPQITFDAFIDLPCAATPSQHMPAKIYVRNTTVESKETVARLVLKEAIIELWASTIVQLGMQESAKSDRVRAMILIQKFVPMKETPLEGEGIRLNLSPLRVPDLIRDHRMVVPSFQAHNIHHSYSLVARVEIRDKITGAVFTLYRESLFEVLADGNEKPPEYSQSEMPNPNPPKYV